MDIVILMIILIIINIATYKEVWVDKKSWLFGIISMGEGFMPRRSFWYLTFSSIGLFIYGLYLNDITPIILF